MDILFYERRNRNSFLHSETRNQKTAFHSIKENCYEKQKTAFNSIKKKAELKSVRKEANYRPSLPPCKDDIIVQQKKSK